MIILAGHTRWKMQRLVELCPAARPHALVYNGEEGYPRALQTKNTAGRDIHMYWRALCSLLNNEYITLDSLVTFVNDDVEFVHDCFWDMPGDVVGVPNLSSWVDYENCNMKDKIHHMRRGRVVKFIRTSCFRMRCQLFLELYASALGNAQRFEKGTLRVEGIKTFVDPRWAYDSNIRRYM